MNQLKTEKRSAIIRNLCEGQSIRGTARICEVAINTVVKLLLEVGPACAAYQDEHVRDLHCLVVQCDEVWSFVGKKMKRTSAEDREVGKGDAWTWTAIDADSKLMITWLVGLRSESDCRDFIDDLASRLSNRIQLSTDGFGTYKNAVKIAFGPNVDYGIVVKMYGENQEYVGRYSPAVCTSCHTTAVIGDPVESQISTSYVERQNLNIRMGCRRFTRLTNAFSKKLENHMAAFSLYAFYYNFCRPHQTLTKQSGVGGKNKIATTPAMAAGLTDHAWTVQEMIERVL
jgi:IS1 family transposase